MKNRMASRRFNLVALVALVAACVVGVSDWLGTTASAVQQPREPVGVKQSMLRQPAGPPELSGALLTQAREPEIGEKPRYVPGHVVVKFVPRLSRRAMLQIAGEVRSRTVTRPSYADFHYVSIPEDADPVAAAARLAAEPDVVWAEPDAVVYPLYVPNDTYYRYQWNFQRIGMESAWDINEGGTSRIIVAVLDTGAAYLDEGPFAKAPDLDTTKFVQGWDFIWDDNMPIDFDGHGTHVIGTVGQTTNNGTGVAGMAFNVKIMPVKVVATDWDVVWDAPYPFGASTVARGIRYASDNGAKVLNMSFGALGPNSATLEAMRYAQSKGVFMAIAAGNEANEGNPPLWPAQYAKDIEGAMAVAALGYDLKPAPYSSHRDYVEIAAPGGDNSADRNNDGYADGVLQVTYNPDYQEVGIFNRFAFMFYQGTSMASPHVASLAALLMDQGVTSPQAIEAAIKRFASDQPSSGRNDEIGYGVIDPRATLRGLGLAR